MTFAEKLKSIRKQAGLSQEQLAEKLGASRQAVTKWETDMDKEQLFEKEHIGNLLNYSERKFENE